MTTSAAGPASGELVARIDRFGSIRFDEFMELALYGPTGFYETTGRAGRRGGDFLTSPEVGPLFGTVVARALDRAWEELGRPDPFTVLEVGAGPGTLAKAVELATPRCRDALTYVLVERSAAQRALHGEHLALTEPQQALPPEREDRDDDVAAVHASDRGGGPRFVSLADRPSLAVSGVVLANELLDNLPARLLERSASGWSEVRVTVVDGGLAEVVVPADDDVAARATRAAPDAPVGARVPLQDAAAKWLRASLAGLRGGRVVVIDYATTTAVAATRPLDEWFRTYRGHERGGPPLDEPGSQDLTMEVCTDQLSWVRSPDADVTQASWLAALGIDELVDEGRRIWAERGHVGDLAAMAARSRVREAEALCDPSGLGAFRVLEWVVDRP